MNGLSRVPKAAISALNFGGASVTIPFKRDIMPLLDTLSPDAEAIGAVVELDATVEPDPASAAAYDGLRNRWEELQAEAFPPAAAPS